MLLLKKQTLSFVFFFFFFISLGQTVKNFTISNGLPGNSITCLFKDSNGLLWIATETGLCLYDGAYFKIIGEAEGLKYNLIRKIVEDNQGNIWLSVYGNGIAKYDGKKFTYYSKKQGLVHDAVRSMYFSEKDNCMVFGTEDGLSVFDGKKFKNFDFKTNNPFGNFQVNFISNHRGKIIFGINHENLYELKISKNNIENSKVVKYRNPKTINYSGFIDGDNFYNRNFLNELEVQNLKTNQKQSFGKCPVIWDFAMDKEKSVYTSCWEVNTPTGGIFKLQNGKLTDLSKQLHLPTSQFWCLYYDQTTEQLWAGSVDKGLFAIDLSQKISYFDKEELGVDKPEINSFWIDSKGCIWYGGNNFIAKKNPTNGVTVLTNEKLTTEILKLIKNRFDSDNSWLKIFLKKSKNFVCNSIKQDEFGTIWAMTNYGLIALNDNLKIIKFQYLQETGGVFDFIDSKNILLSQNYNFGYRIPIQNLEQYKKILYKGKPFGVDATKISKSKNGLWIASYSKGLLLFEKGVLKSMTDLGFLSDKNITDVIVDDQQNIITGTVNGKIYFSRWKNQKLHHLKVLLADEEIIGNSIFFIQQYGGYYLVGTNRGITLLKNYKCVKFIDGDEGLQLSRYSDAQIDYKNKRILVSYDNGLISLDLLKILKQQKVNSPIRINQLKINQKEVSINRKLYLKHYENNLEIYFNSNNIYNSNKNYYRYKIVGLTDNWSSYTSEKNIKLYGLKSGKYQLIIEGKNIGTNEIIAPTTMSFTIYPPFWQTGWFIGFLALVLIVTIFIYVKRKIKNIKHKAELEKRIAETKLQALQSQMNPHFVFNAMNSIQNFVIDNQTDDALWYIGEFSKMMRQTLNFSQRTSVRLNEDIEYLTRYIELENLRRKIKVKYQIVTTPNIDIQEIEVPPMLIQPILENVFVHAFDAKSTAPEVTIAFEIQYESLICQIVDNGKGIDSKELHSKESKGIRLVNERINLLNESFTKLIDIQQNSKGGTTVVVTIPLR